MKSPRSYIRTRSRTAERIFIKIDGGDFNEICRRIPIFIKIDKNKSYLKNNIRILLKSLQIYYGEKYFKQPL